jgi:hypothetical protein
MMFHTKLTLAVLAAAAAIGAQAAVAQATSYGAKASPSFITDTLAPGGSTSVQRYWFVTDTLAPGGGTSAPVQGYRFITDTLAPGGGSSEVASTPSASGFDWGDAGIGAAGMVGIVLALLASVRVLAHRRRPVTA